MDTPRFSLDEWERLTEGTSAFVQGLISAKDAAEKRAEGLELENFTWKAALKAKDESMISAKRAADEEIDVLTKRLSTLQRDFGSMKDDNPLLYCLIDGDGHIFSQDHLRLGKAGGQQAAVLLTKGLTEHMTENIDAGLSGRAQVWLTVFYNKSGLLDTLTSNGVCTTEDFEAFLCGFNQASPWFSIVDVGQGKEAADAKLREHLRVLTRNPQIVRVFFGGGHDNGYASTLNYLQTEGLLEKVTLLRGYEVLAKELQSLNLPQLKIEGVFMTKKLQSKSSLKLSLPPLAMQPLQPKDFEIFKGPSRTFSDSPAITRSPPLAVTQPLNKLHPRPCTLHYLGHCRDGSKCTHGHNYILSAEHLTELRVNAKNSPCNLLNKAKGCPKGDKCIWGHFCPRGSTCVLRTLNKCKFVGQDMHSGPAPSRHRRGRNWTAGQSGNATPPSEDLDALHSTPLMSADDHDLPDAGGSPQKQSDAAYPDIHPVELSLKETNFLVEL